MNERQKSFLRLVIDRYIATAEPVGSQTLVHAGDLEVSGATVRNELRELEELGLLTHPHTSAGRIPTVLGYRYYVQELMQPEPIAPEVKVLLQRAAEAREREVRLKALGRAAAACLQNAVLVVRSPNSFYYTGTSYLFSQPEFHNIDLTISISAVFDQAEDHIDELYERATEGDQILVGSDQPFGEPLSLLVSRVGRESLVVIVGPVRMDYARSKTVLDEIQNMY